MSRDRRATDGPTRIKLCGVRTIADARLCAEAGADEVGVIFAPRSKRCVSLETARAIRDVLPEGVPLVGVFLDQNADEVRATAAAVGLGAAQLHGAWLDEDLGVPRYAVVHVHDEASLAVLGARAGAARVLLDGPAGGGLGSSFPWSLAHRAQAMHAAEVYLAGGLTPQNVAEAIRAGAPAGVDVASGIEGPDGFKDAARVNAFVAAVRGAFQ